jgi:hypothetical protein
MLKEKREHDGCIKHKFESFLCPAVYNLQAQQFTFLPYIIVRTFEKGLFEQKFLFYVGTFEKDLF